MNHLILGGTGTVGREVVKGLLERGKAVRVLTRSAERARALPAGASGFIGDLMEPDTLAPAFASVDVLFLLITNSSTELQEGLVAFDEARRAGVQRIVYLSAQNVEVGPGVPHFAAKVAIERALRESGIPCTILRPSNFHQVDFWFVDAIRQWGIYPQPLGDVGVSRIDVRDIGIAAVNALTQPAHDGRTYNIVGPEPLTGDDCARIYQDVLGRTVRYGGNDLDAFAAQVRPMLPGWLVRDAVLMYALFQHVGMVASPEQLRETVDIIGRHPRGLAEFATEFVADVRTLSA